MLFSRKNFSRRLNALRTFKAYLRTITLSESDQIGDYIYRTIYDSYKILEDYPETTRVYTIIVSAINDMKLICENVDDDEPIAMKVLLDELKHVKSSRDEREISSQGPAIPRLKKVLANQANSECYKKLMRNLDIVIEYYTILSNASRNE